MDITLSYGLLPLITKPTRITHHSATLIDNIYVSNNLVKNYKSAVLSDHLPCLGLIGQIDNKTKTPLTVKSRSLNDNKINQINELIQSNNWNTLNNMDVDEGYSTLSDVIQTAIDQKAPEKVITIHRKHVKKEPFMTSELFKSSTKCEAMYRKALGRERHDPQYKKYIAYRNMYNKIKRTATYNYYANRINEFKNDSKTCVKL